MRSGEKLKNADSKQMLHVAARAMKKKELSSVQPYIQSSAAIITFKVQPPTATGAPSHATTVPWNVAAVDTTACGLCLDHPNGIHWEVGLLLRVPSVQPLHGGVRRS